MTQLPFPQAGSRVQRARRGLRLGPRRWREEQFVVTDSLGHL